MNSYNVSGSHALLSLKDSSGRYEIPVRVIRTTKRQHKVEILQSANKFTRGQIAGVPKHAVRFLVDVASREEEKAPSTFRKLKMA